MPRKLNVATTVLFTNDPKSLPHPITTFTNDQELLYSNDTAIVIPNAREFLGKIAQIVEPVVCMAEIGMADGTMQEGGAIFASWKDALDCVFSGKSIVTCTEDIWGNFIMTTVTSDGRESHFRFKTVSPSGMVYYKRRPYESRQAVVTAIYASGGGRSYCCRLSEKLKAASQKNVMVAQAA